MVKTKPTKAPTDEIKSRNQNADQFLIVMFPVVALTSSSDVQTLSNNQDSREYSNPFFTKGRHVEKLSRESLFRRRLCSYCPS